MGSSDENADLKRAALEYQERPRPGKISVTPTKQQINQHELALAYSPGAVAEELQRLGIMPRVALLSHSNCGSSHALSDDAPGASCPDEARADAGSRWRDARRLRAGQRAAAVDHDALDAARLVHIVTTSDTVRRSVDMTAPTVVGANALR